MKKFLLILFIVLICLGVVFAGDYGFDDGLFGNVEIIGKLKQKSDVNENIFFMDVNGDAPTSSSVGGAFRMDMTDSKGAGLVIYSNQDEDAEGRLLNIRADNENFDQAAIHVDYDGKANAVEIVHKGEDKNSQALNVVSKNELDTALGVSGNAKARGVVKINHFGSENDSSASGLSIDLKGENTAAQGIFIDASNGTKGNLINLRNKGESKFVIDSQGLVILKPNKTEAKCTQSKIGAIYFDGNLKKHLGCDGENWKSLY